MVNINNTHWNELAVSDILTLLEHSVKESFFFEFKEDDARNETLHKEISAFANTYGGYILLGVSDDGIILGCKRWNEEKIHNVIYNGITPTPDFDVKEFQHDGKTFFVIKIEEGSMPPYVTSEGKIYERVSSGSMPIKDSSKLSNLYSKYKDHQQELKAKIEFPPIHISRALPQNLCAYVDIGFEIKCMDMVKLKQGYLDYDFGSIPDLFQAVCSPINVTSVGYSHQITLGSLQDDRAQNVVLPETAMNNYIEIMIDGSAKCRICLFTDNGGRSDISLIMTSLQAFQKIYRSVFEKNIDQNFIYANKFEKLTVIRQFLPYFKPELYRELRTNMPKDVHIPKYQKCVIVSGNRLPSNGYRVIDKRFMESLNEEFSSDKIISNLFGTGFIWLGSIR